MRSHGCDEDPDPQLVPKHLSVVRPSRSYPDTRGTTLNNGSLVLRFSGPRPSTRENGILDSLTNGDTWILGLPVGPVPRTETIQRREPHIPAVEGHGSEEST